MESIINKIKKAGLIGRGGACFPVADKWSMVRDARRGEKFVVCNCSEGEPGVKKDGYIIEHHADRVIDGMALAINFLSAKRGIFYINHRYFKKYRKLLANEIEKSGVPIEIFNKPVEAGYIGGEESAALNVIEGRRAEPRLKPPYPPTVGLFGKPTLINNVETFYNVSLVDKGEYQHKRFYTLSGDCLYEGVYEFADDLTIKQILKATHNLPKFPFFVQVGGDGAGEVLNSKQLDAPPGGAGSIHVYSLQKYDPHKILTGWVNFFMAESCGQCTPCREGTFRLQAELEKKEVDWFAAAEILYALSESSFCGLGASVTLPFTSFVKNVLTYYPEAKEKIPKHAHVHLHTKVDGRSYLKRHS